MSFKSSARGTPDGARGSRRSAGDSPHGMPRFLRGPTKVDAPRSPAEHQAERVAADLNSPRKGLADTKAPAATRRHIASDTAAATGSSGRPLDSRTRSFMEAKLGADLGHVRTHQGRQSEGLNGDLQAAAFTQGSDIFYGAGKSPGRDALTAHELTHVLQQPEGMPDATIHRSGLEGASHPVSAGTFEVDMRKREGAVATPPTQSGLDGYIRFVPGIGAPNSNNIGMVQMVKLTDAGGTDVDPGTMPAAQAPRGALGTPGLRTQDNATTGVEGGFFTDASHRPNSTSPAVARGDPLSPRYDFQPAGPGVTGTAGQTPQPAIYGGGIGGVHSEATGFKRSDDLADIRSTAIYDFPGIANPARNLDFKFETAARAEDTQITYGVAHWGFKLRAGRVRDEFINVADGASATFGEALERHRDFYVHEPVTFYFDFDNDVLNATEEAKITRLLPYLARNPHVRMHLEGSADIAGGNTRYNFRLSRRRATAVREAMIAKGIDAARIRALIGHGATDTATLDAGTGDQGGNAAAAADQNREANRWANRRVELHFEYVAPATLPPLPAPGRAPPP
jgi:outer membrane protein OmpA-like peptidoglycan-associated protein